MKTTGAEIKRFYNDETFWPEGSSIDDWYLQVEGQDIDPDDLETLPDDVKVSAQGVVFLDSENENWVTLDHFFRRWKKRQTHTTALIELPIEHTEELKQLAKERKWRIL